MGCGWDNGEGLSDFKKQPLSEIRKGKLAFWGFAEPSNWNKTRAPWRSRGWEGRMRHTRGANRVRPCGGVTVDGLGGVVNSIIPAWEVLVRAGRQGTGGRLDERWKEVLSHDYFGMVSDHIPHVSLSPGLICNREVYLLCLTPPCTPCHAPRGLHSVRSQQAGTKPPFWLIIYTNMLPCYFASLQFKDEIIHNIMKVLQLIQHLFFFFTSPVQIFTIAET